MPSRATLWNREQDLKRLNEAAKDLPLVVAHNGRAYAVSTPEAVILEGRHEVISAFIRGWRGAQQRSLGTSDWVDTAMEAEDTLGDLASRMLDMIERIEWVKAAGGALYACAFCHAISDRDGGPGHADDCEWMTVTRAGNELRMTKVLR
jgi:hypothetical protein